ncbi:MAG: lipoprotein signal peptidase [Gammaproteobacteria bacterium]|nr:lipoprotein signal peptidase [Gammaproteobacteria bacterium]NNF48693.1 lipoprotein signal peptidase [Woeseiaceae bacterium]MBT8093656.1 lipoprotein signal peptidase [Gammaproteobacteria bacterium]MBT8106289.1 lipoprotein signal peptidase [Gammaproteobacteria bacterium]NNK26303.1 lipoprotein signal peptidase [Woeseiaceae bacterium]
MSREKVSSSTRFVVWMAVAVLVIIADQATKWAIVQWVDLYQKIPINSFINLTHQRNTGAAFSFLADAGGWQRWFFVVLATGVSIVIAVWLWRIRNERQTVLAAGLALVLGGAVGNLIDRAMQGYVTDFIQVWFGNWAFPSFNVADAGITVGAAFLIIDALFFSGREERRGQ